MTPFLFGGRLCREGFIKVVYKSVVFLERNECNGQRCLSSAYLKNNDEKQPDGIQKTRYGNSIFPLERHVLKMRFHLLPFAASFSFARNSLIIMSITFIDYFFQCPQIGYRIDSLMVVDLNRNEVFLISQKTFFKVL